MKFIDEENPATELPGIYSLVTRSLNVRETLGIKHPVKSKIECESLLN